MLKNEENSKLPSQAGVTLVELVVGGMLMAVLLAAFIRISSESIQFRKTLSAAADSNVEILRLLRNITSTFQRTLPGVMEGTGAKQSRERGCILSGGDGESIDSYSCMETFNGEDVSDGIGFGLDKDNKPSVAFVNACEDIPDEMLYPVGKLKMDIPPKDISEFDQWGALSSVCPAACGDSQRPVVRFLRKDSSRTDLQVPRAIASETDSAALHIWGAVLCASYFKDEVRSLQHLYGDNVGGFLPNYLNVTVFVAHGVFDFLPADPDNDSAYVWNSGGTILEFNSTQELATFRCNPDDDDEDYGCESLK